MSRRKSAKQSFNGANDNRNFEYKISAAQRKRALHPPVDNKLVENLHGYRVSDPFRPLEDLKSPDTNAWVLRQNTRFAEFLAPSKPFYDETLDFLEKSVPQGTYESMPSKAGNSPQYYSWRREQGEDRMSLFLKDSPDYGAPARLLLDPKVIDPSGKTDISGIYFRPDGKVLAYTLSVAGSDENTIHFMEVATGKKIDLEFPATRSWRNGITWSAKGDSFTYQRPLDGLDKSFEVMRHKIGTPVQSDERVYAPVTAETRVSHFILRRDMTRQLGSHEFVYEAQNDYNSNRILMRDRGSDAPFREIFGYTKGTLSPVFELDGKIYATTTCDAPNGKLVRFDPATPEQENWETVIAENPKDSLNGVWAWQGRIYANHSHDTADKISFYDKDGKPQGEMPLPPLSSVSFGQLLPEEDSHLLSISGFQEDGAIYKYDAKNNALTLQRASRRPIDLKDCIVERIEAKSKDGTMVPMTVIRGPDTKLDGTAATLLYGYGGFNVPLEPGFSAGIAHWVRSGGIYVQANLRGGGEYGQKWYDEGRRENKQNVFDDFAACAEHLIAKNYTSQPRLAIQGGSNGGLLTLATGLQRPDLFGAIVSEVPVADMNRFHIGSYYGFGWKGDYGDPDIKADFNNAAKYSPYHNVKKGFAHPPILINTDANDDRVLPWHSYKMAALLQAREAPGSKTLLNVAMDGGHGGGGSMKLRFQSTATVHAFLERTLGPVDQKAYKAKLAAGKKKIFKPKPPHRKHG